MDRQAKAWTRPSDETGRFWLRRSARRPNFLQCNGVTVSVHECPSPEILEFARPDFVYVLSSSSLANMTVVIVSCAAPQC